MEIRLKPITLPQRPLLENLFQFYMYDLDEYVERGMNEQGLFSYDFTCLDKYWKQENHHPLFIVCGQTVCGFALLRQSNVFDMEQFFVVRRYRKRGVGAGAFKKISQQFPGAWQIRVLLNSNGALNFWMNAVSAVAKSGYTLSQELDRDLLMHFIRFDC